MVAVVIALLAAAGAGGAACSDEQASRDGTPLPEAATPSPTSASRDPQAAAAAFQSFVSAVGEDRLVDAWTLYAASMPGTTSSHLADRGCSFDAFSLEFPRMRHLMTGIAPLAVVESYGSALGVTVVELSVRGANGTNYLATLAPGQPHEQYQIMFLNSGRPALVPGAPDPLPSPEYPQGFCGIWTGPR